MRVARRVLLLHNPIAGRRRIGLITAVRDRLRRENVEVETVATQSAGDARRIAATLSDDRCDTLLVAGGDGTLNEAASGLLQRANDSIAMALLPVGTANVLAIELGLPPDAAAIAATVLARRCRRVRPGAVTGSQGERLFLLMAGAGFDAHVVAAVTPALKRRFGKAAYGWHAAVQMARAVPRLYRVEIDGESHEAASVIVTRARHYAGPYLLAPLADPGSDDLQVVLFQGQGRATLMRHAIALLRGRLARQPDIRIVGGTRVRIAAVGPAGPREPVQIDGDDAMDLPVEIGLCPKALQVVVPAVR